MRFQHILSIAVLCASGSACRPDPVYGDLKTVRCDDETRVEFGIVGPERVDGRSSVPVVIALPVDYQEIDDVVYSVDHLWGEQATQRGWVVVCPAVGGVGPFSMKFAGIFGQGPEEHIPCLLDFLESEYPGAYGRIHLIQIGWDGSGAFSIALQDPAAFRSVVVLPNLRPDFERMFELAQNEGPRITVVMPVSRPADVHDAIEDSGFEDRICVETIDVPSQLEGGKTAIVQSVPYLFEIINRRIDE